MTREGRVISRRSPSHFPPLTFDLLGGGQRLRWEKSGRSPFEVRKKGLPYLQNRHIQNIRQTSTGATGSCHVGQIGRAEDGDCRVGWPGSFGEPAGETNNGRCGKVRNVAAVRLDPAVSGRPGDTGEMREISTRGHSDGPKTAIEDMSHKKQPWRWGQAYPARVGGGRGDILPGPSPSGIRTFFPCENATGTA